MTPDEHNKERMRAWTAFRSACGPCDLADKALAEFDKRFPAPAAVDTDRERRENLHCVISDLTDQCREANTELAALREKARLFDKLCEELPPGWKQNLRYWDAVASGKVDLVRSADGDGFYANDKFRATAAEAVQAAIDAGALK